jgi:hypothetical protein
MPRFVVLEHETPPQAARGRHWDFMLEAGDVLRTWAILAPPDTPGELLAESLADHRLAYLEYEGPISGDRGSVTRWDLGEYVLLEESADTLRVQLAGQRLVSRATLVRVPSIDQRWIFSLSGN